jgi:hypothetical protein
MVVHHLYTFEDHAITGMEILADQD